MDNPNIKVQEKSSQIKLLSVLLGCVVELRESAKNIQRRGGGGYTKYATILATAESTPQFLSTGNHTPSPPIKKSLNKFVYHPPNFQEIVAKIC